MQNTSLTVKDIKDMSLPEVEYLISGMSEDSGKKTIKGADAINFLQNSGMGL